MDLCIVVDSFDGYCDLWDPFFTLFKMKWTDCPYPIKLVSNSKEYSDKSIETIKVGKEVNWTTRTYQAISSIDSQYIMLLLEDYFLGSIVDSSIIRSGIDFLRENNGKYLRLTNFPKSRYNSQNHDIFQIYSDEEYAINLQASIWDRKFLLECLNKFHGNAWEFEIGFLKEAVSAKHTPLKGCYGFKNDPLNIINGVLKGKWFPSAIKYCKNNNVSVDLSVRTRLSYISVLKYNFTIFVKNLISYKSRRNLKRLLKKLGFKFVSDY